MQSPSEQKKFWDSLPPLERRTLPHSWKFNGRPNQQLPEGDWLTWLLMGGRGMGKTRTGAEAVIQWIKDGEEFVNLGGRTSGDVRKVMIHGESGIIAKAPDYLKPTYITSLKELHWPATDDFPRKRISLCFSADEPDQAQGPQSSKIWCDEVPLWPHQQKLWHEMLFGLRLGNSPQAIMTCTGRRVKVLVDLIKRIKQGDTTVRLTTGSTLDNVANLNKDRLRELIELYRGTPLEKIYLLGQLEDAGGGVLFDQDQIDADRRAVAPKLKQIGMGLDPAVTSSVRADLQGIVIAGLGEDEDLYPLKDLSARMSPSVWSETVVTNYFAYSCAFVVAETNRGGEYITESIIIEAESRGYKVNVLDPNEPGYKEKFSTERGVINLIPINSQQGKSNRATPLSIKYTKHRVHHVGDAVEWRECEDEMCTWLPDDSPRSPNRMDALVFVCSELDPPLDLSDLFWFL